MLNLLESVPRLTSTPCSVSKKRESFSGLPLPWKYPNVRVGYEKEDLTRVFNHDEYVLVLYKRSRAPSWLKWASALCCGFSGIGACYLLNRQVGYWLLHVLLGSNSSRNVRIFLEQWQVNT